LICGNGSGRGDFGAEDLAHEFFGVVGGEDGFADFWVFEPAAKILDDLFLSFVALLVQACLFDLEASGFMIAAAQAEEVEGDVAKDTEPAAEVLGIAAVPCGEFGGVAGGEDRGEMICYAPASGAGEVGGVFGEVEELG